MPHLLRSAVLAACLAVAGVGAGCSEEQAPGSLAPGAQAPDLAYPSSNAVLQAGVAIAPLVPSASGAITGFAIDPQLPAGLVFDPASGIVSGVPAAPFAATTFDVTATGPNGDTSIALVLQAVAPFVAPRAAIALTFEPPRLVHWRIDATSGQLVPGATVETLPQPFRAAVHPSGAWLAVAHLSGFLTVHALDAVSGAPTLAHVLPLGAGLVDAVFDPSGRSLYVASLGSNVVAHFTFDVATGAVGLGSGEVVAPGITDLVVAPGGAHLVGSGPTLGLIGVVALDPTTGAFAALTDFELADAPYRVALDPSGAWLVAVSHTSDRLLRFAFDAASGALTPAGEVPVAAGPIDLAFDATGTSLAVVSFDADALSTFDHDPVTGALVPAGALALGDRPAAVAVPRSGPTAALVPLFGAGQLARADADLLGGAPELAQGPASGPAPVDVVVVHGANGAALGGASFYVAEQSQGTITAFEFVGDDLEPLGVPQPAGDGPSGIAVDATGSLLAVASQLSSEVAAFPLVAGALLPLGKAAPAGFLTRDVAVLRDGKRVFAASSAGVESFHVFSGQPVLADVALAGDSPVAVALSADERFVFAANRGDGSISAFRTNENGTLVAIDGEPFEFGLATEPRALAASPDGRWLYVALGAFNTLTALAIDPASGALTAGPSAFTSPEPRAVAVSPDGRHVVTADGGVNRVTVFRHERDTLVELGSFPVGVAPRSAAFDATGTRIAVASFFADALEVFAFTPATGALTPVATALLGAGAGPVDVAAAPRWVELVP